MPPQFRHHARVDISVALAATSEAVSAFMPTVAWPDAPPFSGGVLTDWPARLTEELAVCRWEWAAVQAFVRQESSNG